MFFFTSCGPISKFKQWRYILVDYIQNTRTYIIWNKPYIIILILRSISSNIFHIIVVCVLCLVFSLFFRFDCLFDCNVLVNVLYTYEKKKRYFWLFVCVYFLSLSQMHGSVNVKIKTKIQAIWLLRTKRMK